MINIFKIAICSLIICFVVSCKGISNFEEETVINDCFLDIIGTEGYLGMSLRPPPPTASVKNISISELIVGVDTIMMPLKNWKKNINKFFLEKSNFNNYKDFIESFLKTDENNRTLNIDKLNRTGRYKLVSQTSNKKIIGKIKFSRVIYNEEKDLGAFIVTISDGPNTEIVKFILVRYEKEVWKVFYEEVFQVS